MAGVFLQRIKVFNRAPMPLAVFFDGERSSLPVGLSEIPAKTIYMAKNQNPIMGSGQAENPTESGTQYLVVEEHEAGFGVPLTEDEWNDHLGKPCRVDEEAAFREKHINDPKVKQVLIGKGNKSTARNRYEAGAPLRGNVGAVLREADAV